MDSTISNQRTQSDPSKVKASSRSVMRMVVVQPAGKELVRTEKLPRVRPVNRL
jgi:hypothetical protein